MYVWTPVIKAAERLCGPSISQITSKSEWFGLFFYARNKNFGHISDRDVLGTMWTVRLKFKNDSTSLFEMVGCNLSETPSTGEDYKSLKHMLLCHIFSQIMKTSLC